MSQTSYSDTQAIAFAGQLQGIAGQQVDTGVSEEASAEIPYGVGVARGTAADGVLLPTNVNAKMRGVVIHSHNQEPSIALGTVGLKPRSCFGVLRRGRVALLVEEAVVAGDRGFVRFAGTGQKGAWRKSAVTNETIDLTAQVEFVTAAGANGLAFADVDFINK
jgi:hypothetical protein